MLIGSIVELVATEILLTNVTSRFAILLLILGKVRPVDFSYLVANIRDCTWVREMYWCAKPLCAHTTQLVNRAKTQSVPQHLRVEPKFQAHDGVNLYAVWAMDLLC